MQRRTDRNNVRKRLSFRGTIVKPDDDGAPEFHGNIMTEKAASYLGLSFSVLKPENVRDKPIPSNLELLSLKVKEQRREPSPQPDANITKRNRDLEECREPPKGARAPMHVRLDRPFLDILILTENTEPEIDPGIPSKLHDNKSPEYKDCIATVTMEVKSSKGMAAGRSARYLRFS